MLARKSPKSREQIRIFSLLFVFCASTQGFNFCYSIFVELNIFFSDAHVFAIASPCGYPKNLPGRGLTKNLYLAGGGNATKLSLDCRFCTSHSNVNTS